MRKHWIAATCPAVALLAPLALAQEVGSNAYIDMYFGDWHGAVAHTTHGTLEERPILTKGDPLKPNTKGAVLRFCEGFSYATLAPRTSTETTRLTGKQEIYYFLSGHGTAVANSQTAQLGPNIAILMPAELAFTINNTGDQPLTMYLITEPIPAGFRPNSAMLVQDENTIPISSTEGFWAHIVKPLFSTEDGLGTLQSILTVTLDPMTIGQPHKTNHNDIEEVWASIQGTSLALVGPFLRRQTPGMAYLHPPDNLAPHTNINYSEDDQATFLYFARYHPHEPRK
jgi:mannose-6-phosphate isomerase-like protein (cupin superfamily)